MDKIMEYLPFIIPLLIVELVLVGFTLYHIFTHEHYKRGNRLLWVVVTIVGMNLIGPVLYFLIGKEEA